MHTHTELGTLSDLLQDAAPEIEQLFHQLRDLIATVHPEAVEVVRTGDRAASYGWGPKKMSEAYVYLMPQARYVNLGFYYGAVLPDPARLLEGTGKRLRHVKVHTIAQANQQEIQDLVFAAKAERRTALDNKK